MTNYCASGFKIIFEQMWSTFLKKKIFFFLISSDEEDN